MKFKMIVEVDENPEIDKEWLESDPEFAKAHGMEFKNGHWVGEQEFQRQRVAAVKEKGAAALVTYLSSAGYVVRQIEEID